MAIQPIVMQSRLINDSYGALPNVYSGGYKAPDPVRRDPTVKNVSLDEDGNEVTTYTIPTYKRTQIDIPADFDWSQYGKAGPALRFFNQVRTGEIEYDPSKDQVNMDDLTSGTDGPPLSTEAELIKQELISVAAMAASGVGAQVGRSVAAASLAAPDAGALANIGQGVKDFGSNFKAMDLLRAPPAPSPGAKIFNSPGTPNAELAKLNTKIAAGKNVSLQDALLDKGAATTTVNAGKEAATAKAALVAKGNTGFISGIKDRANSFGKGASVAGKANLYGAGGAGLFSVAANLLSGKSLKESIKSGAKVGIGTYIGGLFGPVGALLGGILGGRVICNELMRQGIMTRKQVVLDYKFTEDYLTPQHVTGYHVWAVWMVRQMRKGRLVNFWSHVAGHRANEIAYIYGERDKPDYLGKVYRKILEPICWSIGFFCQKTDWTVLYKEKEI
jgi:hypothetical protein